MGVISVYTDLRIFLFLYAGGKGAEIELFQLALFGLSGGVKNRYTILAVCRLKISLQDLVGTLLCVLEPPLD